MSFRNSREAYGSIAQTFHWLIAALAFMQLGVGVYVDDLPLGIERLQWLARHKALGFVILVLVLLRLGWRLFNPVPPLPVSMPQYQRIAARTLHWLLYVLLIAAPLAGWVHASAAGLSVNVFGLFTVPDLVGKDPVLSETFHAVHVILVKSLAVLLVLHIGAALTHALILRDGVFQRMLPFKRR